jgi:hypothetical protein
LLLQALEPRLMFDGAAVSTVAAVVHADIPLPSAACRIHQARIARIPAPIALQRKYLRCWSRPRHPGKSCSLSPMSAITKV